MSKVAKTLTMVILIDILPLLGHIRFIIDERIVLLILGGIFMLQTQPEMKVEEAKEKKSSDRNSIFFILFAAAISQISAIIEWAYFSPHPEIIGNAIVVGTGVFMLIGGLAFRYWAIRTLKNFFTATVQIQREQKVIQNGPYRFVRHPSYLGALSAFVGGALILEATAAAVIATLCMIWAYTIRIRVEERAMVAELGNDYKIFQQVRKYKVIPLVW